MLQYVYSVSCTTKDGWDHHFSTPDYGKFFDEAAKAIEKLLPASVAPAALTELPAMETNEIVFMEKTTPEASLKFNIYTRVVDDEKVLDF